MIKYICDICGKSKLTKDFLKEISVPMRNQKESWEVDRYGICEQCQTEYLKRINIQKREIIDDMIKENK